MPNQQSVSIREVGPRDGLQIEAPLTTSDKLKLIDALVKTGVERIEVTSFVSPRAVPALADAEAVAAELDRWPDVKFSALVVSPNGTRRATQSGLKHLEYVISVGNKHSLANTKTTTIEATERTAEVAEYVAAVSGELEVVVATAWDCPFEGPTPIDHAVEVAVRAHKLGAQRLTFADTIGTATPRRVIELLTAARSALPEVEFGVHFHDTRGMGIACSWAAYELGVRNFDASIGGLGGCPFAPGASGNIATEELVYLFEDGNISTGLSMMELLKAASLVEKLLDKPVPSLLFRAGGPPRPRTR